MKSPIRLITVDNDVELLLSDGPGDIVDGVSGASMSTLSCSSSPSSGTSSCGLTDVVSVLNVGMVISNSGLKVGFTLRVEIVSISISR